MYWIYSTYSLLLKISDVKQHLKMFCSHFFKEIKVFKIKFHLQWNSIYENTTEPLRNAMYHFIP